MDSSEKWNQVLNK